VSVFVTVPVHVGLCLSFLRRACPCWAVPVRVWLGLYVLRFACTCYAVPNRFQLCKPLRVPLPFRNRILTLIPLYRTIPKPTKSAIVGVTGFDEFTEGSIRMDSHTVSWQEDTRR